MVAVWVCQGQVRRAKFWHSSAGCSRKSPRTNAESPRTARGPMQQLGLQRVYFIKANCLFSLETMYLERQGTKIERMHPTVGLVIENRMISIFGAGFVFC